MSRLALLTLVLAATGLAACTGQSMAPDRDPRGDLRLAQALAGKVADRPVACLASHRSRRMEVIDHDTLIYRDGRTTYVQHTSGSCYPNGPSGGTYLVTKQYGSTGLCRGEIGQVFDTSSRTLRGSCSFNDFIPYRAQ